MLSCYERTLAFQQGQLEWSGVEFNCMRSDNTILLPLFSNQNECLQKMPHQGQCGPYNSTLSCRPAYVNQTAILTFVADYNLMNGRTIMYKIYSTNDIFQNTTVRVGGKKPLHVKLFAVFAYTFVLQLSQTHQRVLI